MGEQPHLGEFLELAKAASGMGTSQAAFVRVGKRVFAIKGPRYHALWSERNRKGVYVIPLFGGWRITIRKVSA